MAAQEGAHRSAEVEAQEELARVRQDHHEGEQAARPAVYGDTTEVAPVDLSLLSRQGP